MNNNEMFAAYLKTLPVFQRNVILGEIRRTCNISRYVTYNWLHGRSELLPTHRAAIERIIGVNIEEYLRCYNKQAQ